MKNVLVLQSDFGLDDGAVSAMYGVAKGVDRTLEIHDLTHGVTPFQILEGSYRLFQTVKILAEGYSIRICYRSGRGYFPKVSCRYNNNGALHCDPGQWHTHSHQAKIRH